MVLRYNILLAIEGPRNLLRMVEEDIGDFTDLARVILKWLKMFEMCRYCERSRP
jgi:hypothetical protein